MINPIFKFALIGFVLAQINACGGGPSTPTANSTTTPPLQVNNKTIYFESDFDTDSSLRLKDNDIGIYLLDNLSELTERIPFTAAQTGEYELCLEGAGNILEAVILDSLAQVVLTLKPVFPLDCSPVTLQAGDYSVALSYVPKIANQGVLDAPVPFIRMGQRSELKAVVDPTDWNEQLDAEIARAGVNPSVDTTGLRTCYSTPKSNNSLATFRVDSHKLRLSFKPDLSQGTDFLCTYQIVFVVLGQADIGDLDTIIAGFANRPIISSRPRPGNQSASITDNITVQFRDSIDRTSIEALSVGSSLMISPPIGGVISLRGQVLSFNPSAPLTDDTRYSLTFKGLTQAGTTLDDISYTFKTEKAFIPAGTEDSLSNDQLCALGVSEFCSEINFSSITGFSAAKSGTPTSGSRLLIVQTSLENQKPSPGDILIEYEFIDNRDQSIIEQNKFIIGYGETAGQNSIAWPIDDFEKTAHSVSMRITKISNAFGGLESTGNWTVYNGELYNSEDDVVSFDANHPLITAIELSGNISSNDLRLTTTLDRVAAEDINIEFSIAGGCQWVSGVNTLCLDPGVITIPAGSQQAFSADLIEPDGSRFFTGSITVTIANTRNANTGAALSATRLLDETPAPPANPLPPGAAL